MYGLSLTASLLCASATRFFASAIRRAMSSAMGGEGVAVVDAATDAAEGVAAAEDVFFSAASLAAISALFWAIRASPDN